MIALIGSQSFHLPLDIFFKKFRACHHSLLKRKLSRLNWASKSLNWAKVTFLIGPIFIEKFYELFRVKKRFF